MDEHVDKGYFGVSKSVSIGDVKLTTFSSRVNT
jgi:hypothetical protein